MTLLGSYSETKALDQRHWDASRAANGHKDQLVQSKHSSRVIRHCHSATVILLVWRYNTGKGCNLQNFLSCNFPYFGKCGKVTVSHTAHEYGKNNVHNTWATGWAAHRRPHLARQQVRRQKVARNPLALGQAPESAFRYLRVWSPCLNVEH